MAEDVITLPAGTERRELISMPTSGHWNGLTRVRVSTHTTDATLHEWLHIHSNGGDNKIRYRRVAATTANNWYNSVLKKDTELGWWMVQGESLFRLTYTSSNPLSVIFETTRGIQALPYPPLPASEWNKKADAKPWLTNISSNDNPTEAKVFRPWLDGVCYWVNK